MSNPFIRYPKDWLESKRLVKNLEAEFKKEQEKKNKNFLQIIKIVYTILYALDEAIVNSNNSKELKKLLIARQVLSNWIKDKNF